MLNKKQIQEKIEKLQSQLKVIEAKELEKENKVDWVSIDKFKKGYEITNKQQFNNQTYEEILKQVKEEQIADYPLLQELRNSGEFNFLKDFWVFVPNPDIISKKSYVVWLDAGSGGAFLGCGGNPTYRYSSLGVFLVRRKNESI